MKRVIYSASKSYGQDEEIAMIQRQLNRGVEPRFIRNNKGPYHDQDTNYYIIEGDKPLSHTIAYSDEYNVTRESEELKRICDDLYKRDFRSLFKLEDFIEKVGKEENIPPSIEFFVEGGFSYDSDDWGGAHGVVPTFYTYNEASPEAQQRIMDKAYELLEQTPERISKPVKQKQAAKKAYVNEDTTPHKLKVKYTDIDYVPHSRTFSGRGLHGALLSLVDALECYLTRSEARKMSPERILDHLNSVNGDGCDYITELVDLNTNEVLMDYEEDEYYD